MIIFLEHFFKMYFAIFSGSSLGRDINHDKRYDSIATVGEIRVYWRADFQSGSRVLKKVF